MHHVAAQPLDWLGGDEVLEASKPDNLAVLDFSRLPPLVLQGLSGRPGLGRAPGCGDVRKIRP